MKKIIPIFLLIIICVNHLNIIDTIVHFSSRYYKEKAKIAKCIPIDEESEHQKDTKSKDKIEEEKYYQKGNYNNYNLFSLSNRDKFTCFNTRLHKHPYQDDDLRPPRNI